MTREPGPWNARAGDVVVYDEYGPTRMIRTPEWKYICRYPYGPDELYHLTEDPDEDQNLIHDDEYKKVADELYVRLSQWFHIYADPAVDGAREGVTGYGQMCRPGIYAEKREKFHAGP